MSNARNKGIYFKSNDLTQNMNDVSQFHLISLVRSDFEVFNQHYNLRKQIARSIILPRKEFKQSLSKMYKYQDIDSVT